MVAEFGYGKILFDSYHLSKIDTCSNLSLLLVIEKSIELLCLDLIMPSACLLLENHLFTCFFVWPL